MESTKIMIIGNIYKKLIIIVFILIISFFGWNKLAKAQVASGISVTPSVIKIDLETDRPATSLTYKNTTNETVDLNLSVENFSVSEDNKITFLTNEESTDYKYSLSQAITLDTVSFTLKPQEKKDIAVSINAKLLKPGSHFASIQAEIIQKQTTDNVTIGGVLSNLTFVRSSTGSEIEDGSIENFRFTSRKSTIPTEYSFKFINKGNLELIPFGIVDVKDVFGKSIGTGVLNANSLITFPETSRTYSVPIQVKEELYFPGFYTADLKIRYAKSEKEIHQSIKFFTYGSKDFLIALAAILVGFFGILFIGYKFKFKRKKDSFV